MFSHLHTFVLSRSSPTNCFVVSRCRPLPSHGSELRRTFQLQEWCPPRCWSANHFLSPKQKGKGSLRFEVGTISLLTISHNCINNQSHYSLSVITNNHKLTIEYHSKPSNPSLVIARMLSLDGSDFEAAYAMNGAGNVSPIAQEVMCCSGLSACGLKMSEYI